MTKKILIVCICLVTICSVLGLNDRLNYDGLQTASTMISAEASQIVDDMAYLQVIAYVAERYGEMDNGRLMVSSSEGDSGAFLYISYVNHNGTGITKRFEVSDIEVAEKIDGMLIGFQYGVPSVPEGELFSELIDTTNTILHFFGFIFSAVVFLLQIIFDVFTVAYSVVEAAFYLLGF